MLIHPLFQHLESWLLKPRLIGSCIIHNLCTVTVKGILALDNCLIAYGYRSLSVVLYELETQRRLAIIVVCTARTIKIVQKLYCALSCLDIIAKGPFGSSEVGLPIACFSQDLHSSILQILRTRREEPS